MGVVSLLAGLDRHRLIAGSTMEAEQFGQRSEAGDDADKLHSLLTPRTKWHGGVVGHVSSIDRRAVRYLI
jgi:hypothetical protein